MDASAWVAVVAAVIALASVVVAVLQARSSAQQARAAQRQTELQQKALEEAAQPYVWADFRMDAEHGYVLMLVITNEGPTVATDVEVTFDPPLPPKDRQSGPVGPSGPLRSLPPGRRMSWWIGSGPDLSSSGALRRHQVRITGTGPHGPLPVLEYDLDMNDFGSSASAPPGSLAGVTSQLEKLTKAVQKPPRGR